MKLLKRTFIMYLVAGVSWAAAQNGNVQSDPTIYEYGEEVQSESPSSSNTNNNSVNDFALQPPKNRQNQNQQTQNPRYQQQQPRYEQPAQRRRQAPARQGSQVTTQPTTVVEASPLTESEAEKLRKKRQEAEVQTEQQIVEKLEESRLEDEKKRAKRLFGDNLDGNGSSNQRSSHQASEGVTVVEPEGQFRGQRQKQSSDATTDDIVAAIEELKTQKKASEPEDTSQEDKFYISGSVGMSEYPDVNNVTGNVATGLSVGVEMANQSVLEGSFTYSNYYTVEYWRREVFKELDQYNFTGAAKYSLLSGRIRPVVGALGSFTYRKYFNRNRFQSRYPNDDAVTSSAVDVGLLAGLDLGVSETFAIGADFRYMINMVNKSDNNLFAPRYLSRGTPLEELDYYMFSLVGKIRF